MEFQLSFRRKAGKGKPESSETGFLEKLLINKCVLSDAEDNTSGLLSRGVILDLTLLRTLLAICCKSHKPSFWEVINCFAFLA